MLLVLPAVAAAVGRRAVSDRPTARAASRERGLGSWAEVEETAPLCGNLLPCLHFL